METKVINNEEKISCNQCGREYLKSELYFRGSEGNGLYCMKFRH